VPVNLDSFNVASQLLFYLAVCKLQNMDEIIFLIKMMINIYVH
jgi:hypothetical protein